MSRPLLHNRKQKVSDGFKSHNESWQTLGCTSTIDAWTDKGRGVMNLVFIVLMGSFLWILWTWTPLVTRKMVNVFDLVGRCIEDIGEENVVQVVTDNASVNIAAASLLAAKRPSIFWNGCAAHRLDLMLEDIGKLEPRQQGSFGHGIAT
jgi:hypothetical protein